MYPDFALISTEIVLWLYVSFWRTYVYFEGSSHHFLYTLQHMYDDVSLGIIQFLTAENILLFLY